MKKVIFALIITLLCACGEKGGGGGNNTPPPPPQDSPKPPAPSQPEPSEDTSKADLTVTEVIKIRQLVDHPRLWGDMTDYERAAISGAQLDLSTSQVHPMEWETLTSKSIREIINLFFDKKLQPIR